MPDEEKKLVPIDTSGPDAEIAIEETKDEAVVETENTEQEQGTDKSYENERETKLEEKKIRRNFRGLQQRCTISYCETNS
jgi:hypothetical protein